MTGAEQRLVEAIGFFPTPAQELLLRAVFLEPEAARAAFAEWRRTVDFAGLDRESLRLIPRLYRRALAWGGDAPELPEYRRVYMQWFTHNQLLFQRAGEVIGLLRERGIEVL